MTKEEIMNQLYELMPKTDQKDKPPCVKKQPLMARYDVLIIISQIVQDNLHKNATIQVIRRNLRDCNKV